MQNIDLQTTQNVTIEYELASLGERILAMLIDLAVVVGGYMILLSIVLAFMDMIWAEHSMTFMSGAALTMIFISYHFLFEFLGHGQSLGKRVLSIQVVRLDGDDVTAGDYMLRTMFYFVDLFSSGGVLGGLLISSTPKRQRFGDMAAGTAIIKLHSLNRFNLSDILNISSLEDYEPQYIEVRQFTEQDMLLIKSSLSRYQRYPNDAHRKLVYDLAKELAMRVGENKRIGDPKEFLKTLIRDYIVLTR